MSRVLFSVWFRIQGIIKNTTSSVWFRIQHIIKNVKGIIQRLVQDSADYSGYYSKYDQRIIRLLIRDSGYYLKMSRVLFSVRISIQHIIKMSRILFSVWFRIQRIIKKCTGYYSASGQDSAYY